MLISYLERPIKAANGAGAREMACAAQTTEQIVESVARLPEGTRFQILGPVIQRQKGEYRDLFEDLLKQGAGEIIAGLR